MQADLAQRRDTSAEDLRASLQNIEKSTVRATHTVNQLLALARAESGGATLTRQACNLAHITTDVVLDSLPRAMDKHIDLGYDGPADNDPALAIEGNPTLLKELVRNLVDNAINYTPSTEAAQGVITARVLVDPYGKTVVLQVEDTGPGIPDAEKELVFQPFYRALGNGAEGSGLGLAIVREIAAQHGATLTIEDARPGVTPPGTRFTLRFQPTRGDARADALTSSRDA
jgi:two-component system sensor histidine kinase TctE